MTLPPLVFVDLETTGATATADRITEVGIVEVEGDQVKTWSTLINPGCRIPEFIERLTGITTRMVAGAPPFAEMAGEIMARLQGRLFVAHNARFDYGFLKNEFKRCGIDFRATVLCTVKLSRRLYPGHQRHSLDALIERHALRIDARDRHRALGDARLIHQFWQQALVGHGASAVEQAVAALTARPSLPTHLDPDLIDTLPEGHGVYLFYAENDLPLYVGKSNSLKKRVLAHFAADHANAKEMSLSQQVRRVDWIETAGELGALLLEARLVKQLQPTHNRQLRRQGELCTWQLEETAGLLRPRLLHARDLPLGRQDDCYGLFRSARAATQALAAIADETGLCRAILGLEKVKPGKPCFGYQLHTCQGACVGAEAPAAHNLRLLEALAALKLQAWPYPGPVALREGEELHVVDAWCYLGTAKNEAELADLLEGGTPAFDADTYKLLGKFMGKREVVRV